MTLKTRIVLMLCHQHKYPFFLFQSLANDNEKNKEWPNFWAFKNQEVRHSIWILRSEGFATQFRNQSRTLPETLLVTRACSYSLDRKNKYTTNLKNSQCEFGLADFLSSWKRSCPCFNQHRHPSDRPQHSPFAVSFDRQAPYDTGLYNSILANHRCLP